MTRLVPIVVAAVGVTSLATGCASSPRARLEACRTDHPDWEARGLCFDLAHGLVEPGMTAEQVLFALGDPLAVEVADDDDGDQQRWTYYAGPVSDESGDRMYVILEDGIVVRVIG